MVTQGKQFFNELQSYGVFCESVRAGDFIAIRMGVYVYLLMNVEVSHLNVHSA